MASLDEKQVAVARVYSRAMLDLADSGDQARALLEELQGVVSLADENEGFKSFLASPLVDIGEREKSLEKLFRGRASDLLVNTLQVLNRHHRLSFLETVVQVFRQEYQDKHGLVDVHVTSAVPLNAALREELKKAATKVVGREPDLIESVDESLIGGLVVRIGDRKVDNSVATELRKMKQKLENRAALEIQATLRASGE